MNKSCRKYGSEVASRINYILFLFFSLLWSVRPSLCMSQTIELIGDHIGEISVFSNCQETLSAGNRISDEFFKGAEETVSTTERLNFFPFNGSSVEYLDESFGSLSRSRRGDLALLRFIPGESRLLERYVDACMVYIFLNADGAHKPVISSADAGLLVNPSVRSLIDKAMQYAFQKCNAWAAYDGNAIEKGLAPRFSRLTEKLCFGEDKISMDSVKSRLFVAQASIGRSKYLMLMILDKVIIKEID